MSSTKFFNRREVAFQGLSCFRSDCLDCQSCRFLKAGALAAIVTGKSVKFKFTNKSRKLISICSRQGVKVK